jgi:phosphoribosylanthranilate isomerase
MAYHLRIKICGVTNVADSQEAVRLGADAIGLNFYAPSVRSVERDQAEAILRELPPLVQAVGIFVNQPLQLVCTMVQPLGRIHTVQWHGEECDLSDCYPFHLIQAFPVRDAKSLLSITRYLDMCQTFGRLPSAVLVDAHVPGQHGGTGQTAPWNLLASFRPGVPVILAGGLTPENVAEAVRIVQPYAVDVASGVEVDPGRKDAEKMRRFIGNAREAAARL